MKSIAFNKKSIAFHTKIHENYRKSIRIHQKIAMKSIALNRKSVALDTKTNGHLKKKEIGWRSRRNH